MKRQYCVFFLCVFSTCVYSSVLRELFPLDIIHYNDFHDRFEETTLKFPVCQTNDTNCFGGFARLTYEIKALLKEKPNALLLNAGDAFQGTYWYLILKWNVTQHFLNMLPHDAHTIGNHEFNGGIEGLAPFLAALRAPVLVANIDNRHETSLDGLYTPHIVLKRNGRKIGLIGVSTVESISSSRTGNLIFLDPVKVVTDEAKSLTERGVDIIVVLSHCGLEGDKLIAKAGGADVDIIVGGHSHSLLFNGLPPSNEITQGPYPLLVESESKPNHKVLIVQAAAYTRYLGNITAYFDINGELVSYDGIPVFLNRSIPEGFIPDPEMKLLLQPYKDKLHGLMSEVVGYANDDLINHDCRRSECAIGDIIVDAFTYGTKTAFPSNLTRIGIIHINMIKGSLRKGDITRGSLINLSPFSNQVVSVVIAGRYLMEALEMSASLWWHMEPFQPPYIPSVSGMQVALNTTSRKVSVLVDSETGLQPLDLEKEYQVTMTDHLYNGGHGLNMFKHNSRDLKIVGQQIDVIENYIRKVTPLSNILDKRLTVVK